MEGEDTEEAKLEENWVHDVIHQGGDSAEEEQVAGDIVLARLGDVRMKNELGTSGGEGGQLREVQRSVVLGMDARYESRLQIAHL